MIGMLWFDNDPKARLEDKIKKAADYYRRKYGREPSVCYVRPPLPEGVAKIMLSANGIEVRTSAQIQPNHLLIGVKDS